MSVIFFLFVYLAPVGTATIIDSAVSAGMSIAKRGNLQAAEGDKDANLDVGDTITILSDRILRRAIHRLPWTESSPSKLFHPTLSTNYDRITFNC